MSDMIFFFFFQAEDGIRDLTVTGVQTCALPISRVPSFSVKSTLRLESIAAPHFPQTSAGLSCIGYVPFYRTSPRSCFDLPSCCRLAGQRRGGIMGECVETGVAIAAAVHADTDGAQ